jgi:lambda repressor-like predicted transcriptional regulator
MRDKLSNPSYRGSRFRHLPREVRSLVTGSLNVCTDVANLLKSEKAFSSDETLSAEILIDVARDLNLTATDDITLRDAQKLLEAYCKGRRSKAIPELVSNESEEDISPSLRNQEATYHVPVLYRAWWIGLVSGHTYGAEYGVRMLFWAPDILKTDRGVVMAAVKRDGRSLVHSGRSHDREIVMAAVKQHGASLYYASEELRADREIVMAAVTSYNNQWQTLVRASEELRADREIVMAAVKRDGRSLAYASEELRADREVVMAAVRQHGISLESASEELRADREVVMAALMRNGDAMQFASDVDALYYASDELRADREFMMEAVGLHGMALAYASEPLKADRELVLRAVREWGEALEYASDELRADRHIIGWAVKQDRSAIEHALLRADC